MGVWGCLGMNWGNFGVYAEENYVLHFGRFGRVRLAKVNLLSESLLRELLCSLKGM